MVVIAASMGGGRNGGSTLGTAPRSADRGGRGDRVPVLARSHRARGVPTVLPCRGHAAPPWPLRCWPPCTCSPPSSSSPARPTPPRGSPSRLMVAVVPSTPDSRSWSPGAPTVPSSARCSACCRSRWPTSPPRRSGCSGWPAPTGPTSGRGWSPSPRRTRGGSSRTFGLLLLFFPDGRLPSRRWVWVPPTMVACAVVTQAYGAFEEAPFRAPLADLDRPFGPPPLWLEIASLSFFLMLALFVACAVSLVLRFRRGDRTQRQQIKWLALAGIGMPLYPLLCLLEIVVWGEPHWVSAAVGIASLVGDAGRGGHRGAPARPLRRRQGARARRHLGPPHRRAARGLRDGLVGGRRAGRARLRDRRGRRHRRGRRWSCCPRCAALRRVVDARTYPLRRAALAAVDDLHREVSAGRARPEQLQEVLRESLRDPGLRVGFRVPGSDAYLDGAGEPVPDDGVPVLLDDEQIGVIVRGSGPASVELLREVSGRCTTLVEVVRLRLEVAGALRGGRVQPGAAARGRVRRASPPRAGPARRRPATAGVARHVAAARPAPPRRRHRRRRRAARPERRRARHRRRRAPPDRARAAARAAWTTACPRRCRTWSAACRSPWTWTSTTARCRTTWRRPPTTSSARRSPTRSSTPRRRGSCSCVVRRDGQLLVRVTDDGCGGARLGLRSGLVDRVAALGGSLHVASPRGRGTEVEAVLPCAS